MCVIVCNVIVCNVIVCNNYGNSEYVKEDREILWMNIHWCWVVAVMGDSGNGDMVIEVALMLLTLVMLHSLYYNNFTATACQASSISAHDRNTMLMTTSWQWTNINHLE